MYIVTRDGYELKKAAQVFSWHLKMSKREIFVTELFTLSDPIWIGDMRTEPKKPIV